LEGTFCKKWWRIKCPAPSRQRDRQIDADVAISADAEGGLKTEGRCARFSRVLGAISHQQAAHIPVYCRYLLLPNKCLIGFVKGKNK